MPPTFDDPVLGELTYDHEFEWWDGQTDLGGHPAELRVQAERDCPSDPAARRTLGAALTRLRETEGRVRAAVATRLLDLAEDWRDDEDDPEPLTVAGVMARIVPTSVELSPDGGATLYYADGELFAGHIILAGVDASGHVTSAGIAG